MLLAKICGVRMPCESGKRHIGHHAFGLPLLPKGNARARDAAIRDSPQPGNQSPRSQTVSENRVGALDGSELAVRLDDAFQRMPFHTVVPRVDIDGLQIERVTL